MKKENNKNKILKVIPMLIMASFFLILSFFNIRVTQIENYKDILSSLINFIAITTGFIMTTLSVLASASNSRIIKKIAYYNKIKELNMFFVEPLIVGMLIILLSMIALSFDAKNYILIEAIVSKLIIALIVHFFILFFRIGYISMNILEQILEENINRDQKEKCIEIDASKAFENKI